jgi:DNA repair exonuclease SbcCD nuclease subunit
MRILFTSDFHIKLGQKNVPIDWQINRFRELFADLNVLAKDCDTIVIGGDIFDKLPSMAELELYFEMLATLKEHRVLIYPGNHEALKKNTSFLTNLKMVSGSLTMTKIIDDYYEEDNFQIVPYTRLKDFEKNPFYNKPICFSHFRGEIPPHVKPEVNLDIFDPFKLVLAGDLHSHSNSQRNIIYPGSPITTSFHRTNVDTGVIILDTSSLEWSFIELNLPQLIRKKVSDPAEMVPTDYDHTIYELECEVGSVKVNNDLLDKKLVKKASASTLNFTGEESLSEEVRIYLTTILKLDNEKTSKVLNVLHDNIKETDLE